MNQRRRFIRTLAAGGTVGVAGCLGADSSPDDSSDDGETEDVDETATTGDTELDGTVRIGVLAPLDSPVGPSMVNAAELAARQLNENGGVDGAEVEILARDTKGNPSTGRQRYRELVLEESVDATTGVFVSEVLLALMDDIANTRTVHLTTGAATPRASAKVHDDYERYRYHFRTGPLNAIQLGQYLADFAVSQFPRMGWNDVAMLLEDYEWTRPVEKVVDSALRRNDVELVSKERFPADTNDYGTLYDQVESAGADAAFVAMAHTGGTAVSSWAKEQRPFGFGGIHVPSQLPSFYDASMGTAAYTVTQNVATPQSELTDKTQPFVTAYETEYHEPPAHTGYTTYDAVKQYAAVVEDAGTTDADAVVSGLERSSHTGTIGTIEYHGKDHEFAHDAIYASDKVIPVVQQWQPGENASGTQAVVYPPEYATSEYQQPEWL